MSPSPLSAIAAPTAIAGVLVIITRLVIIRTVPAEIGPLKAYVLTATHAIRSVEPATTRRSTAGSMGRPRAAALDRRRPPERAPPISMHPGVASNHHLSITLITHDLLTLFLITVARPSSAGRSVAGRRLAAYLNLALSEWRGEVARDRLSAEGTGSEPVLQGTVR